jgi:hypothetical protein
LDQLQLELTSVRREQQLLEVTILSAFSEANGDTPVKDDVVSDARAMMAGGFEVFHGKLRRQRELEERAKRMQCEIHSERARHPGSEFGADVDVRFDPDLEVPDGR